MSQEIGVSRLGVAKVRIWVGQSRLCGILLGGLPEGLDQVKEQYCEHEIEDYREGYSRNRIQGKVLKNFLEVRQRMAMA
jgi:hypothetical protein